MLVVAAPATPALAGADRVTGGVTVPDGRLTGGGAGAGDPLEQPPPPASFQQGGERRAPYARAAQEGGEPETEAPPPKPDEGDVEVRVPVRDKTGEQAAPVSPAHTGGLAQTGFAAAALAAVGAVTAAAGLALRRLTRC